jgi:hypothetical protein
MQVRKGSAALPVSGDRAILASKQLESSEQEPAFGEMANKPQHRYPSDAIFCLDLAIV